MMFCDRSATEGWKTNGKDKEHKTFMTLNVSPK